MVSKRIKHQLLSNKYMQDTDLAVLCNVNKARVYFYNICCKKKKLVEVSSRFCYTCKFVMYTKPINRVCHT